MRKEKAGFTEAAKNPSLDEYQIRRFRVTFEYIDALLEEIEDMLDGSASQRVFPRIIPDIPEERHAMIEECIADIRGRLIEVMEDQGIAREPPSIPASRAGASHCTTIHIALEELKPGRRKNAGDRSHTATDTLSGDMGILQDMVAQLEHCIGERAPDEPERVQGEVRPLPSGRKGPHAQRRRDVDRQPGAHADTSQKNR
jgi:hypothetical protein